MVLDPLESLGSLALGSRLRRLSDLLMSDGANIYESAGLEFKPVWFPLVQELAASGPTSLGEAATKLKVSHVAINQVAAELEARGLVESSKSESDARVRILSLTALGQERVEAVRPAWAAIRRAMDEAIEESGADFLQAVASLERVLRKRSFRERFEDAWNAVDIRPYEPADARAYFDLNHEWISSFFVLEPIDEEMLRNPDEYVLKPGGEIFMAIERRTGEPIGTSVLLPHGGEWELAKMAVSPLLQGKGIGRRLAEAVIEEAKSRRLPRLVLETNSQLKPAIRLYETLGFRHTPHPKPSDYARSDVYMILDINGD